MRLARLGLVVLLVSPLATAARPQQGSSSNEQESLADVARRAQTQKKNQPQATKVWNNDNIPTTNSNISVVGQSEGETASSTPPPSPVKTGGPATAEQKAAIQADLKQAKAQLESLKADLDVAQRKYALDEQTHLSNPNYVDKSDAQALDDEKEQIAAKQQEIADMQRKVDDLQAQVEAANSSASK
jgi:hypothetical protein